MPTADDDHWFQLMNAPDIENARKLYRYWRQKHRGDTLPTRTDIEFEDLVNMGCADLAFIMEPLPDGDWQYRLLGSTIAMYFGKDVTGIPFRRHMLPDEAEEAIRISNQVVATKKPTFLKARFASGEYIGTLETMSLPILSRDESAIWLFGASFFIADDPLEEPR